MRLLLAGLFAAVACGPGPAATPVRVQADSRSGQAILVVVPAENQRINARVPPAIELATGGVLRLTGGRVSPDSSYFLEPPWVVRPIGGPVRGLLRASVCGVGELVCRVVTVPVSITE